MLKEYWGNFEGARDKYQEIVKNYKLQVANIRETLNEKLIDSEIIKAYENAKKSIEKLRSEHYNKADAYVEKMKNKQSDVVRVHLTDNDKILFALEKNNKILLAQSELKAFDNAEIKEYYIEHKGDKVLETLIKSELGVRGKTDPEANFVKTFVETDSKKTDFDTLQEVHRRAKMDSNIFVTGSSPMQRLEISRDIGQDVAKIQQNAFFK